MRIPNFDQMGWSPIEEEVAKVLPPPVPLHMALEGIPALRKSQRAH
jgi:hypothetical protein